ncbi:MAG: citrate/2-methylcitrate synthase, partial [Xanthobacteraceae bacterium]
MKIGPTKDRASAISTANAETIVVRGRDLCRDLIGSLSFTQYFWLLVTGEAASAAQARVLDACLVAIAEHGLVPSVQAARMTYAAGPEAMQGAVAAGILGCGSVILGASETAGRMYSEIDSRMASGAS